MLSLSASFIATAVAFFSNTGACLDRDGQTLAQGKALGVTDGFEPR